MESVTESPGYLPHQFRTKSRPFPSVDIPTRIRFVQAYLMCVVPTAFFAIGDSF